MPKQKKISVVDLFAGPGGLAEGFSSIRNNEEDRIFDVRLSIEKDDNAHKTLELRSFFRQFKKGQIPNEYYDVLREPNLSKREMLKSKLFEQFPREYKIAKQEAWQAELGAEAFPPEVIDKRIKKNLGKRKDWLLIGGPPCQAYSLVGRARRQETEGLSNEDHRVYLYKEYLRIIAVHQPAVFVMENVKGLLSAKVGKEKVFDWILNDLRDPASVFEDTNSKKYKIYSLSTAPESHDEDGYPSYQNDRDFLIQAEKFNIPQKRHRVILLGIREDIDTIPEVLKSGEEIDLKSIIKDLPKLRSGLGRSIVSSEIVDGKKKRTYQKEIDSDKNWEDRISEIKEEVHSWNGFTSNKKLTRVKPSKYGVGSEFVPCETPSPENPLAEWYKDDILNGACNHQTRTHLMSDLKRYFFASTYAKKYKRFPRLRDYEKHSDQLMPDHESAATGKFADRFRVQMPDAAATTVTSHISKDGHYFIHYDPNQCRSLTVREAARIQTFPDNYLFCGTRTAQYHQVGNAVPPYLAKQIAEIVLEIFK